MGRTSRILVLVGAALLACSEGPTPVSATGVRRLRRVTGSPGRQPLGGRPGDLVLDNGRTQVVVSNARRPGFGGIRGAIVDVGVHDLAGDALRQLATFVEVEGSRRRVVVNRIVPSGSPAVPGVEVRGSVQYRGMRLAVTTLIRLPAPHDVVEIITRVENRGQRTLALRVIDDVSWEDAGAFVPGLGRLAHGGVHVVPWFARAAGDASYAYAARWGASEVRFEMHPMLGETGLERAVVLGPVASVPAGGRVRSVRALFVAAGDVARAFAAMARFHGTRVERVRGRTEGLGAGAGLRVLDEEERPVVEAKLPADGSFAIDLPAGTYLLETELFGRTPPPRRRIVVGAGATPFVLLPAPDTPGRLAVHVRDEGTADALPARLLVRGIQPTADPVLGPSSLASGAGYAAHTRSGDVVLTMPAGHYRIAVSHGPEWTLHGEDVVLRPGEELPIEANLRRAVATDGLVSCDLHLHAAPSPDSNTTIEDRLTSLVAEGVEVAAATDHNHVTDYASVIEALGLVGQLTAMPGDEVTTGEPHIGHFNVYPWEGPFGDPGIPFVGQSPPELFAAIRAAQPNAVLQVNHPWGDNATGYFSLFGYEPSSDHAALPFFDSRFDAIEVWNGMWLGDATIMQQSVDGYVALLALGKRVVGTGSSDSHHMVNQWVGYPRTYAYVADDDPERFTVADVAEALRAGHAFVTTGPIVRLVVEGGIPGDVVATAGGGVAVTVSIAAAPWVQVRRLRIWVGAEPSPPVAVPLAPAGESLTFVHEAAIPMTSDGFVLVTVEGDVAAREVLPQFGVGPRAFTNPVWVDGDGDGQVTIAGHTVARIPPPVPPPAPEGDAGPPRDAAVATTPAMPARLDAGTDGG